MSTTLCTMAFPPRLRPIAALFLSLFLFVFAPCWTCAADEGKPLTLTLIQTGNLHSAFLQPSATSDELARRLEESQSQATHKGSASVLRVDTGNFLELSFVSESAYVERPTRFFEKNQYDVVSLGARELLALDSQEGKWRRQNVKPEIIGPPNRTTVPSIAKLKVGSMPVYCFSLPDSRRIENLPEVASRFEWSQQPAALKRRLSDAATSSGLKILLSDMPIADAEKILSDSPDLHLVCLAWHPDNDPAAATLIQNGNRFISVQGAENQYLVREIRWSPSMNKLEVSDLASPSYPLTVAAAEQPRKGWLNFSKTPVPTPQPPPPSFSLGFVELAGGAKELVEAPWPFDDAELWREKVHPLGSATGQFLPYYVLTNKGRSVGLAFHLDKAPSAGFNQLRIAIYTDTRGKVVKAVLLSPFNLAGHNLDIAPLARWLEGQDAPSYRPFGSRRDDLSAVGELVDSQMAALASVWSEIQIPRGNQ
ncbi:MAG: hypothetical protein V2A74_00080 [bacterium]